jgi:hypothetical protein
VDLLSFTDQIPQKATKATKGTKTGSWLRPDSTESDEENGELESVSSVSFAFSPSFPLLPSVKDEEIRPAFSL